MPATKRTKTTRTRKRTKTRKTAIPSLRAGTISAQKARALAGSRYGSLKRGFVVQISRQGQQWSIYQKAPGWYVLERDDSPWGR